MDVAFVSFVPGRRVDAAFSRHVSPLRRTRTRAKVTSCRADGDRPVGASLARGVRALSFAIALTMTPPAPANARGREPLLSEQTAQFTLPSMEAASSREEGSVTRAVRVAKHVVPPVAAVTLAVYAVVRIVRAAQRRRIRDFQSQLQSLSSMLSLDTTDAPSKPKQTPPRMETRKYRIQEPTKAPAAAPAETDVKLDLFRTRDSDPTSTEDVPAFELAATNCVRAVCAAESDNVRVTAAVAELERAAAALAMSVEEVDVALGAHLSALLSARVDSAVRQLDSDDAASLRNLDELTLTMRASALIASERGRVHTLRYSGAYEGDESIREELYRRYAVFCLSAEHRMADGLRGLADMQSFVGVSDARAEGVNKEIARGMFQVAVSAAMADGGLDDSGRDAIDKLRNAFSTFLEGDDADAIMSEVAVMRAMYALQQLLAESGVDVADVQRLRDMCGDLGVDIDEMMKNADALGSVLGPEAKQFVESLSDILKDAESAPPGEPVLTTSATPVEPTIEVTAATALPGAEESPTTAPPTTQQPSTTQQPPTAAAKSTPDTPPSGGGKQE